jgi:hypothetical protein
MNPSPPIPTAEHPWRNAKPHNSLEHARELAAGTRAMRRALSKGYGNAADNMQGFHVTHVLVYEHETVARVYRYRGMYYTLEQWSCGELGLRKDDLREGERFVKV